MTPWMIFRMDNVAASALLSIALFSVAFRDTVSPALAGLAISYALQLMGRLQMTVRTSIELENNMTGFERLTALAGTPQESSEGNHPPENWPQAGGLEFFDVRLRYRPGLPEVLKGLSFSVPAGSSVGICGRTGAGKSSVMVALFRMAELHGGRIEILKGFDISETLTLTLTLI